MIPGGLLGPVGGLEQVFFTAKEPEARASRYRERQALSGEGYTQVLPRRARVWSCEIPHDAPQEGYVIDSLEALSADQRETLVWYPAAALGTNMLDPAASLMDLRHWDNMSRGGARVVPGGNLPGLRFHRSGTTGEDGPWSHLSNIPVPGTLNDQPVTLTASIRLTAYQGEEACFYLDELGMDNQTLTVHKAQTTGVLERLSFTFQPRADTVAVTFGVWGASAVVAPQLTMTDRVTPWGVGRGCLSCVVEVTERDPLWTATGQHIYEAADATRFTIRERVRMRNY